MKNFHRTAPLREKSLESRLMLRTKFLLIFLLPGCTCVNQQLNPPEVPIEARVLNHTRADIGADVAATLASPLTPGILPSTRPTTDVSSPLNDGFFVGLSLSGVMTFFFGGIYFQYHINRINELKRMARYRGAAI